MYWWRVVQLKVTSDMKQLIPECFEKVYIQSAKRKKKELQKRVLLLAKLLFKKWGIMKTFPEKWTLRICY